MPDSKRLLAHCFLHVPCASSSGCMQGGQLPQAVHLTHSHHSACRFRLSCTVPCSGSQTLQRALLKRQWTFRSVRCTRASRLPSGLRALTHGTLPMILCCLRGKHAHRESLHVHMSPFMSVHIPIKAAASTSIAMSCSRCIFSRSWDPFLHACEVRFPEASALNSSKN